MESGGLKFLQKVQKGYSFIAKNLFLIDVTLLIVKIKINLLSIVKS